MEYKSTIFIFGAAVIIILPLVISSPARDSVLLCDPTGPYSSCGGNKLFDSTATCQWYEAQSYGEKSWCTQAHCCKPIPQSEKLAIAMALDGTECNCPRSHPCVTVQFGRCLGTGHQQDYDSDTKIIDKCYDEQSLTSVPCINGYVAIPKGQIALLRTFSKNVLNGLLDISIFLNSMDDE